MRCLQILSICPSLLLALPQGHRIAHGAADLSQIENRLEIAASDASILEWSDFSIESGESVQFIQPSSKSIAVNRVFEPVPSRLLGSLEANGQILLINPNGILVGKEAVIDTHGLICSTLPLDESLFFENGNLAFVGASEAEIINEGKIIAREGDAFLIARHTGNWGEIESEKGSAGLIAADHILIKPSGADRLFIRPSKDQVDLDNVYSMAFRPSEAIQSGKITSPGNTIYVLGDHIELRDSSRTDASSPDHGGTIYIGGEWSGSGQTLANAKRVYSAPSARISASALEQGDGGRVVVWGDEANFFYGNVLAEGGRKSGDGGLIEISCRSNLDFQGTVSTLAPNGMRGNLLLDPSQITIGPAGAPQAVNGACGFPVNTFALNAAAGNLSTASLLAAMVGNNVTVTTMDNTCGPFGGTGDILVTSALMIPAGSGDLTLTAARNIQVNAAITNNTGASNITLNGAAVSVSAAINFIAGSLGSCTINATNGITITDDIQIPGSGNVILNETGGGAVTIGGLAYAPIDVSVGSRDGLTQLCAPNSAVTIQARTTIAGTAQLGFFTPNLGTSTGPIEVSCDTLRIQGGTGNCGAFIGHGQGRTNVDTATAATMVSTPSIHVYAEGTITLQGSIVAANNQGRVWIGHGSRQPQVGGASADQAGEILVVSRAGDIILTQGNDPTVGSQVARIGHGGSAGTAVAAATSNLTGNITVKACNGSIALLSAFSNNSNICMIGHGHPTRYNGNLFDTQIEVTCLRDLTLNGSAPNSQSVLIGCASGNGTIQTLNQSIVVTAGGALSMSSTQNASIGTSFLIATMTEAYNGHIQVAAGSINMTGTGCLIGVSVGPQMGYNLLNGNTSVLSMGNLTMDVRTGGNNFSTIEHGGDVSVAALGTISLLTNTGSAVIGTSNRSPAGFATTRIYAGGSITISNQHPLGSTNTTLGFESNDLLLNNPPLFPGFNVDIRAGGDLQLSRSIAGLIPGTGSSTQNGSIFIQADSPFPPGLLYGGVIQNAPRICALGAGTNFCQLPLIIPQVATSVITSICGFPLNIPLNDAYLLGVGMNPNSGNLDANGFGGFSVANLGAGANNIILQTTTGDITVNSACSTVGLAPQNLNIGTVVGTDTLQIRTNSGDITISGSVCGDAFNQVSIRSVANPWTSGSILVRACTDLNVQTPVATIGANSPITLIADNNQDLSLTPGNLNINANISTMAGPISLSAGLLDPATCLPPTICRGVRAAHANINHASSTVVQCLALGGTILETASGSIHINNATIQTLDGSIHMLAGVDININSTIRNTAANPNGEIILVANRDIHLSAPNPPAFPNPSVISSLNPVTLVADNSFPSPPLLGSGKITMVSGSSITGNPLQLYTSEQPLNVFSGTLNGASFAAGTIFENTISEQWCTYFGCPFQRAGLGIPYTVFYKNCLRQITRQAMVVIDALLVDLHPYNEFPGWKEEFYINYEYQSLAKNRLSSLDILPQEPYLLRRRLFTILNQPKSWTQLLPE